MQELKTLGRLLLKRIKQTPGNKAMGWIESQEIKSINFKEYGELIEKLSLGLIKNGLQVGDKLAIFAHTCKEWHLLDMATLCSRGVTVPIYPSYLTHEVEFMFNHSESKILVVENDQQMEKIIPILGELKNLKLIVTLTELNPELIKKFRNFVPYITYKELLKQGQDELKNNPDTFELTINSQASNENASIIYTSGTTGEPKGALITQYAFVTMLENVQLFIKGGFGPSDRTLTFLPLSHVLGRCDSMLPLIFGWEMVFAESIDKIVENIALVKPTVMLAVPRIFEKIYAKIKEKIDHEGPVQKQVFELAVKSAEVYFAKIDNDQTPAAHEIIAYKLAYKFIFSKIYQRFGGHIRFFVSGGAPLSPDIIKFLRYANLTILEGYGLTETIAPCSVNPTTRQIPGTVGKPMGDVEFKFAEDGEIMIKTKALFKEYYKNPEATKEAFDGEWFHSGDIGHFTPEGYLKITDRKKDLIVTSGGKKIAPQKIENMMKSQKYISHFICVGDKQKYMVGIVGLEKERFLPLLEQLGLPNDCSLKAIAAHPKVKELIQTDVDNVNKELAQFETVKKFFITSEEFTLSNFLTPSLKIKRKVVLEHFAEQIAAMYQ